MDISETRCRRGVFTRIPASWFILIQVAVTCLVATWSLGGRADGVIWWIGGLCWASLLAVLFDPDRAGKFGLRDIRNPPLLCLWGILLIILGIAAFNAQTTAFTTSEGTLVLQSRKHISWLPAALVGERAREYGFLLSGVMVLAVMIWHYLNRRHIRLLIAILAINALVLALIGAFLNLTGSEKILGVFEPVNKKFFATFRYHNHWTAFAMLSLGQSAALLIHWLSRTRWDQHAKRRRPDLFWLCVFIVISITLTMTGARAGILFFVLFWLIVVWRFVKSARDDSSAENAQGHRSFPATIRVGALGLLVLGIGGYLFSVSQQDIKSGIERTSSQYQTLQEGGDFDPHRFSYAWQDTSRMIRERPLSGWGFGNHKYAFYIFAGDHARDAQGVLWMGKEFAHNDWLQFIAELGIPGFVLLITVPLLLFLKLREQSRAPEFATWLLLGPALVLILATFEFPLSNPAVLLIFFAQAAAGLRYWSLTPRGGACREFRSSRSDPREAPARS